MVVVFALGRLNHYTQGFRTKVETDQEPLTSIWKKPVSSTSARVQRLLLRLLKYDIDLQYIPGKRSVIAHALSRVSPLPFKSTDIKTVNCIASNELSVNVPATPTRLQEYQNSTQNDPTLQLLTQYTHQGWPESCKDCPHELLGYWMYRECISLENGLLFKDNRL